MSSDYNNWNDVNVLCGLGASSVVLQLISTFIGQNKKFFFMHASKKGVLHLCTWLERVKLEIHLI